MNIPKVMSHLGRLRPVLGGVKKVGVPQFKTGVLGSNSNFLLTYQKYCSQLTNT